MKVQVKGPGDALDAGAMRAFQAQAWAGKGTRQDTVWSGVVYLSSGEDSPPSGAENAEREMRPEGGGGITVEGLSRQRRLG